MFPMLDVFNNDAFSLNTLTDTINKMKPRPTRIGEMGLFHSEGIPTTTVVIEELEGQIRILPVGERGAPAPHAQSDKRKVRSFVIPHIPYDAVVRADEIQNVRSFGSRNRLMDIRTAVNQRLRKMNNSHEVTLEYHRIGALKGKILDADGSSVIYDLYNEFGVSQHNVAFALGTANTEVRVKCMDVRRLVDQEVNGYYNHLHAFCGPVFLDKLLSHKNVKSAYERYQDGAMLRNDPKRGFPFGDIFWEEYIGQVNGIPFIEPDVAYVFPKGAEIFKTYFAPADMADTVNTNGVPRYVNQERMKHNKGIEIHTQSNPLSICLNPSAVIKCTTN